MLKQVTARFNKIGMATIPTFMSWGQRGFYAATQLAETPPPKRLRPKRQTLPSYVTTAAPSDNVLPTSDLLLANTEIPSFRNNLNTPATIRDLSKASPDLSAACSSVVRMAVSANYTVLARDIDGVLNPDATRLAQQLATKFDKLSEYDKGFAGSRSIRSNSEALGMEILRYGSCSMELVLGPDRLPSMLMPVSTSQIRFKRKPDQRLVPLQIIGQEEIDLDIPTFFYAALDQDLLQPYSESPLQAAIQPILGSQEFIDDLRRIFKKAISPRLEVKIDEEKFRKTIPPNIQNDQPKIQEYMNSMIATVSDTLNGLNPEDALVYFDSLSIGYINGGNNSLSDEYEIYSKIMDGKMASGAKSTPVVLGHAAAGSTNIASTQSMLFVRNAEGMVQEKLNEIYSRAFTLAVRLFGLDVTVEFKYDRINLRPEDELEAFKAMKQSRILEQLSLGMVSDDEASIVLTGNLPPATMIPLSGTGFTFSTAVATDNPLSNTSKNAQEQTLDPDTPEQPKGEKKEQ